MTLMPAFSKRKAPILDRSSEPVFRCPIREQEVHWAAKDVFNPAAMFHDGRIHLLVRAEDAVGRFKGTSRIGLAVSRDGIAFELEPEPVLYPDNDACRYMEWEGGCEDPRVLARDDGTYILTYTAYDGTLARLCVATSRDLRQWTKHGSAFASTQGGRWANLWSKSGVVVSRWDGNRLVAVRLGGRFWMLWGEGRLHAVTSDDGIAWEMVEGPAYRNSLIYPKTNGSFGTWDMPGTPVVPLTVAYPRPQRFDQELVEPGPAAILTNAGIELWYNGAGPAPDGRHRYCGGIMVLDPEAPIAVLSRATEPFFVPDQSWELAGQCNAVTFIEGLARLNGRELLYYGCADSRIGLAERPIPGKATG